ncbi:MAG: DUF1257 domain-containing protein [Sporomusaceae bacterium]|jgi:hypothetical protein|nr:DUF1257 domain-containing protein [Sporomusaceae bacterium]
MSHFTQVATKLSNKEILLCALKELGLATEEKANIKGFRGQETYADIAVRMKTGYDVGFVLNNDGTYSFIADWFGVEGYTQTEFVNSVRRQYALATVKEQVARQGFNLVTEQKNADGSIKVVVRRWV